MTCDFCGIRSHACFVCMYLARQSNASFREDLPSVWRVQRLRSLRLALVRNCFHLLLQLLLILAQSRYVLPPPPCTCRLLTLSFLSLYFWKKVRKTHQIKTRISYPYRTPKFPGKEPRGPCETDWCLAAKIVSPLSRGNFWLAITLAQIVS